MSDLRGLAVKAMSSESKGREFESRCGHASEINHDIHLVNTLFQIKNMAAVCSGISLFMLALSIPRCNSGRRYSVSYTQCVNGSKSVLTVWRGVLTVWLTHSNGKVSYCLYLIIPIFN